jgi:RimJ/RimL family protein N-acetyltransferase
MQYDISSKTTRLIPVLAENVPDLILLAHDESVRRLSTLFPPMLNLTESRTDDLVNKLRVNEDNCSLFKIELQDKTGADSIVGLYDIDRNQGRGYIVYLCSGQDLKQKKLYEPLKLICGRAFSEWRLDRLYIIVEATDRATATMLKGFGFKESVVMEGYSRWNDELFDVQLFVCSKNNFRSFNAAE